MISVAFQEGIEKKRHAAPMEDENFASQIGWSVGGTNLCDSTRQTNSKSITRCHYSGKMLHCREI